MLLKLKASALKQGKWYEYLVRFALGGAMTVVAGLIAEKLGPEIGGLFLAFPAIFCASARWSRNTNANARKARDWKVSGAAGMRLPLMLRVPDGLVSRWILFSVVMWWTAAWGAAASLSLASLVWLLAAAGLWLVRRKIRRA